MNSLAEAGMTLRASPPSSLPTAIRVPPLPFREMACRFTTAEQAASRASFPSSGAAPAWAGTPEKRTSRLVVARNPCVPHINVPGPSALKPIWKPNSTSTPSTAPASDIGRATLFGRLEDQAYPPPQVPPDRNKHFSQAKPHGGVPIVSARVHQAGPA